MTDTTAHFSFLIAKSAELAAAFINHLPFPDDAFAGVWEAVAEHGNYEDTYRITFRGGGSCFVEVTSTDPRNRTGKQSAEGSYSYFTRIGIGKGEGGVSETVRNEQ